MIVLSGATMGTSYVVKFSAIRIISKDSIQKKLDFLEETFSTYNPDSEIGKINRLIENERKYRMSDILMELWNLSQEINQESEGSFSVKIGRLMEYWGFGAFRSLSDDYKIARFKDKERVHKILECSRKWNIDCARRKNSFMYDFSGIAKGYAVDKIADLLKEYGIDNYMIEIGGEVCVSKPKPKNTLTREKWKIGLSNPAEPSSLSKVLHFSNGCLATSGNSQQFFLLDGKRLTHIIDPRTGYPVERTVSSVSVFMDEGYELPGARADAWATAFYVMGVEDGMRIANQKNMAVLYLYELNGDIKQTSSDEWKKQFGYR